MLAGLGVLALTAFATPASARWSAGGTGSGSTVVATMPGANQPSGSVSGQTVTVTWTQSTFLGARLGTYLGGGYTVKRYPQGGSTPTVPNAGCATTISGAGATLQCVEAGVPHGSWQYSVTPLLNTFTGPESTKSATVAVAPPAPALNSVAAQNPAGGQTTGAIQVSWSAVAGATGYNVYRRTTGAFDDASPLNGATPIATTSYSDPGAGLSGGTTYRYVVRAVAGSPSAESASSSELNATAIARPAAPAGVAATAVAGAQVSVGWSSVAGVTGYNVYRRASGTYDFSSPLNAGTPVAPVTYLDTTSSNATTYRYTIRAVITGAGGAQVESLDGTESAAVIADGVAPAVPTAASVTSGGPIWGTATCSVTSGTRYINTAGQAAVGVSATIAAPEAGQSVVFSATSTGSTPVAATVAAGGTSVSTSLNLTSLLPGAVTLTARTKDAAGNLSASLSPPNPILKDVSVPALTATYSGGLLGLDPHVSGASECGATVVATKAAGGNVGATWSTTIASGTAYNIGVEGPLLGLGSVTYSVVATSRAGNPSATVTDSG
ncbi:MAG: hypothetical protein QOI64_2543 [Solirubrobacteraceae bacterium]|nr:hypothetical protein [Solirubrobacteraceae bacterium]